MSAAVSAARARWFPPSEAMGSGADPCPSVRTEDREGAKDHRPAPTARSRKSVYSPHLRKERLSGETKFKAYEISLCYRSYGKGKSVAAGSALPAKRMSMCKMSSPARLVTWDGGPMQI